ncbi:MAG: hypothetical protein K0S16_728 [Moraxellaceae bacterium]|nr:hypothetical protein [Moraxellaceae bacterium]
MPEPVTLRFASTLDVSREEAWRWITSVRGIATELRPLMGMSVPPGVTSLADLAFVPEQRLFRSRIMLFGLLPVDFSDLTLLELKENEGFVEQSPMGSMRLWRHERRIGAVPGDTGRCTVTDLLSFEPRLARGLSTWAVKQLFTHRHAVLRRELGGA